MPPSDDFSLPLATSTWDDRERAALIDVIDSDRFTMGPRVAEFERAFAEFVGSGHAVMVNSGSSANLLAVAAAILNPEIRLAPGDEVLVPAVSWATTYSPLHQYGLRLVFVDVDPETLNMDLDKAREAITPRTRAVFAVNLLGNPQDFDALGALTAEHDLLLLEDNCEALGATFAGRQAGTFGLLGTYSSFFSHHISTMEGGLVVTDDERTYQTLLSLRAHGWIRDLPADNLLHRKSGDPFEDSFRFVLPGYNVRPLEMSGALGLLQLEKLPSIVAGRRRNAEAFQRAFASVPGVRIQREVGESSWFGFALTLTDGLEGRRGEVVRALADAGVDARPIVAGNFTRNPVIDYFDATVPAELPHADDVHDNGLFIGNHHYDVSEALNRVAALIRGLTA
ncbi:DegT/DnrJ/EryC1/StrS family aminotransferase [Demequina muriae]|uniref:DegT/DnrJ/EryC1/StrS family aminotransferase n=1 Tax=Demequina muriae TaxID=3051664 RepID=A0ABT8GG76_9MICO|nr:DegT/DnrJ/EryC1/StrS family aminotransferase [Demequina sp. EGI L300058]MDN4480435.1 DegT/DnrJ/EryC1/StrS family aminotransferase [Demequina sp. EGI L300058]